MPAILLYLLKANVALILFYLAYHFVLRRLTFYTLNRGFLLFGILFSALYPLVDLSLFFERHEPLAVVNNYAIALPTTWQASTTTQQAQAFDYWLIPVGLVIAGAVLVAMRLLLQFISLYKIHAGSVPARYNGIDYRQASSINHAFSFWQAIYLNPKQHKHHELNAILNHELVHVKGWHTLDVLLIEFCTLLCWFNPGGWLMKRAIKENLEFIADQNVLTAGVDRKDYQYLLLKVTGISEPQIANQFNFSPLKTRIAMMNKLPSTKANKLRLLIALPLVAVLLVAFKSIYPGEADGYTKVGPAIYIKDNPSYKTACWTAPHNLTITPVTGTADVYELDNKQDIAAAVRKYGLYLPDNELYDKVVASIPGAAQEKRPQVVDEYKDFYARNPQVRKLFWTSANQIIVRLETTEEIYNLDDKASRAAAEKKYGKLPSSPPPAEVVTQEEFDARSKKTQPQDGIFTITPDDIDYYDDKNNLPVEYTNFLKRNTAVEKVGWRVHSEKGPQSILIYLKSGATEVYDYSNAKGMATAKSKYGELPGLLPPPPPVRIKN